VSRAALLVAPALVLLLSSCGGTTTSAEPTAPAVRAALEARLTGKSLSYRWVFCVRTARTYSGETIFRCNVNFGEPHIVRFCATLDGDRLTTNREQPAITCGRRTAA
jgi:hypothetical protein